MRKLLVSGLAAGLGLAGWINVADAELFSATRPVIAIFGADLYVGAAVGRLSGAGTLAVHSQAEPSITCSGDFTSSAELGGNGHLNCSDGASATFQFKRLDVFRGHGAGTHSRGAMSFTYGLSANESGPYLVLPPGKKLSNRGELLALVDF